MTSKSIISELKAIEESSIALQQRSSRLRRMLEEEKPSSSSRKGNGLSVQAKDLLIGRRRKRLAK